MYTHINMQLSQLIMYYTPKKVLPFAFFNLPVLQKPGRNRFPKRVLKDLFFSIHKLNKRKIH